HPELGTPGREDGMSDRAEPSPEDDGQRRLPQVQPRKSHGDDADEDGGELQVRGKPGPEEIDGLAVPLLEGYVLDAARLDGGDPLAVVALANRDVLFYLVCSLHWPSPMKRPAGAAQSLGLC